MDTPETSSHGPAWERMAAERFTRLEKENARLRRLTMSALVITTLFLGLAVALVVTAARHGMPGFVPQVVESREFLLRDGEGRVRGAWGTDDEGAIRLVLQDPGSGMSAKLNLLRDGTSGITFSDSLGNPRLVAALLPDATGSLVFVDQRGLTRTVLSLSPGGASQLVFADQGGNTRSGLGLDSRGRPMFTVTGEPVQGAAEPDSGR